MSAQSDKKQIGKVHPYLKIDNWIGNPVDGDEDLRFWKNRDDITPKGVEMLNEFENNLKKKIIQVNI